MAWPSVDELERSISKSNNTRIYPSVDELERSISKSNNTRMYPSVDELEKAVRNPNTQQGAYIPNNTALADSYLNPQRTKSDRQIAYDYAVQEGLLPPREKIYDSPVGAGLVGGIGNAIENVQKVGQENARPTHKTPEQWQVEQLPGPKKVLEIGQQLQTDNERDYEPYSANWWAYNIARGLPTTVGLAVTAGAALRTGNSQLIKEAAKQAVQRLGAGARVVQVAGEVAPIATVGAVAAYPGAAILGQQAFEEAYQEAKTKGMTPVQATAHASKVRNYVTIANIMLQTGKNTAEIIAGLGKLPFTVAKNAAARIAATAARVGVAGTSEAVQEGTQQIIPKIAQDKPWSPFDEDVKQSAALGFGNGVLFFGVGKGMRALENRPGKVSSEDSTTALDVEVMPETWKHSTLEPRKGKESSKLDNSDLTHPQTSDVIDLNQPQNKETASGVGAVSYLKEIEKVSDFVDEAIQNKDKQIRMVLGKSSPEAIKVAKRDLKFDMADVTHEMDMKEIRHALKRHSHGIEEAKRGQLPITAEDFKRVPEILNNPDSAVWGYRPPAGSTNPGSIIWSKRFNGTTYYIETYYPKKKILRTKTMWKKPSVGTDAQNLHSAPGSITSEAKPQHDSLTSSSNSNIPNSTPLVKDGNKEFMAAPGMSVPNKSQRLDTPTGETVTGTVTRRQIVDKIDELFTKVRSGRVGMRGVLGWFNRDSEVIRTKDHADFPTIMHEIGHYLDKGLGLRNDSRFDGELLGAVQRRFGKAYDDLPLANKRGEGIAEFIHDYTIDPARAQREFPGYFAAFEQRLAQEPAIKAKLDEVRQQLHIWHNQAAEARGRGAVTRPLDRVKKNVMEKGRDLWFNFRKTIIDDKVGLSEFVVMFEKLIGRKLSFDENPYLQSRMALSSATARAQMVVESKSPALTREVLNKVYGAKSVNYDVTMRSILDKLENNKELAKKYPDYLKKGNFEDWTAALDTYLVAQRQIELQKLNPDYKGPMNPSDAKTIVQGAPVEVAQAAKEFYKYNDNLLRIEVVGGLISPETYVDLTAKHKFYASMVRDFANEEANVGHGGSRKSFGNVKSSLKSLGGGAADNVQSPIETAIIRTYDVFNRVERNKVAQTFAKLAKQSGVGRLVENVQGKARASEYVFTVMERGVERAYETTPETYRALMSMNQESGNILIKILSVPAGWMRAGATLTPDFVLRNLGRDTFSAAVYSKHGFIPLFDTVRGLSLLMNDPKLYAEYQASGAQMATFVSMDRNHISQSITKLIKNNMISKANPIEWLRAFSDAAETATRLAEFKKARDAGKSIPEAGLDAKDITVDFNRAGTEGRKFNMINAFFNAAVQGTDRMARAFKEDPIGFNMRALMWVTMPSIALWLINHDQEWYREEPDWVKNTCWMFKAGDTIYRMPKPPGLGQIYGSSVETALDYYKKQDPRRVNAWAKTTLDNLLPGIGVTAVEPIVEWVANYSFFRDKPIVPQHEQGWSPDQQFGPYTSEAAKFVGRQLNVSPRKVDNLIQGYTASMGKMVSSGIDYAAGKYENLPEQQIENLPGLRSVMSRPFQNSQSVQDFYEEYKEQKELHSKMEQTGVVPKDYNPQRYAHLKSIDKDMSQIRKREKQVMNSNMTPREKRDQLDKLRREAIDLAREGLRRSKIAQ